MKTILSLFLPLSMLLVGFTAVAQDSSIDAEYPGGDAAMEAFLYETVQYPQDLIDNGKEAQVIIAYTVDEEGKVTKVSVLKSSGFKSFDDEAVRVYSAMPIWKPAMENGKPIGTDFYYWLTYTP